MIYKTHLREELKTLPSLQLLIFEQDRLWLNLAYSLFREEPVSFDAKSGPPPELLQLLRVETAPFIILVAEDARIAKEKPCFRLILGCIPGAAPVGIEEFSLPMIY